MQVARTGDEGCLFIACWVVLGQLEKRLAPFGIVETPVGDRRASDAGFKFLRAGHQVEGDGATAAPTPDSDPAAIHPRLRFEPTDTGQQIRGFPSPGLAARVFSSVLLIPWRPGYRSPR